MFLSITATYCFSLKIDAEKEFFAKNYTLPVKKTAFSYLFSYAETFPLQDSSAITTELLHDPVLSYPKTPN